MDANREVIELINRLQGYGISTGCKIDLNLPQIVVVGAQSCGKSSVLDGLIGTSILPRGTNTVTKCPIIVQLITTSNPDEEGVEFKDDQDGERIKDYDIVREKLLKKMNEKMNNSISSVPIILRVFSPNVVTLTVVDLPGVKRLSSAGEPNDLAERIADLSRKYIKKKNAIILAVSPANYDICNSDGLLLAREADPEGKRTIGVLTKLDIMDQGTNARDLLTGKVEEFKIKLGMIGLVNRSQKDVERNMSVEEQLVKEKKFLRKTYPDLANVNGVPYLRKRLHELLVKHINKCLPEILENMKRLMEECDDLLRSIPDVESAKDKQGFVRRAIYRFESNMRQEIEGSLRSPAYAYLYGGVKIKDIFEKQFPKDMDTSGKESRRAVTDAMILNAFRNSGSYDSFFAQPEAVFRKLAQSQVAHLYEPALKCAGSVYTEIQAVALRSLKVDDNLRHFPELKRAMKNVVSKMMEEKMENLKETIKDYIRVQSNSVLSLDQGLLKQLEVLRRKLEDQLRGVEKPPRVATATALAGMGSSQDFQCNYNQLGGKMMKSYSEVEPVGHKMLAIEGKGDPNPSSWNIDSSARLTMALEKPETIKTIKKMVETYFNHVKGHCLDYIPKLISDRIIALFSGGGSLGEELLVEISDKSEELAKLPPNVEEDRMQAKERKKHLKVVIAEVNGILEHNMTEDNVVNDNFEVESDSDDQEEGHEDDSADDAYGELLAEEEDKEQRKENNLSGERAAAEASHQGNSLYNEMYYDDADAMEHYYD